MIFLSIKSHARVDHLINELVVFAKKINEQYKTISNNAFILNEFNSSETAS